MAGFKQLTCIQCGSNKERNSARLHVAASAQAIRVRARNQSFQTIIQDTQTDRVLFRGTVKAHPPMN